MSRIPFDEALLSPEPFLLAWRITPPEPGQRTLSVFSLEQGGVTQVAWRRFSDDEVDSATAEMVGKGHRVGRYSDGSDHVWLADQQGVTVWHDKGLGFQAEGETLRLADGSTLSRDEIKTVILYAGDDYLDRGLRAQLADGRVVDLLVEMRWTALSHPLYNRDDLVFETEWAVEVGGALSNWAGAGYDDRI